MILNLVALLFANRIISVALVPVWLMYKYKYVTLTKSFHCIYSLNFLLFSWQWSLWPSRFIGSWQQMVEIANLSVAQQWLPLGVFVGKSKQTRGSEPSEASAHRGGFQPKECRCLMVWFLGGGRWCDRANTWPDEAPGSKVKREWRGQSWKDEGSLSSPPDGFC